MAPTGRSRGKVKAKPPGPVTAVSITTFCVVVAAVGVRYIPWGTYDEPVGVEVLASSDKFIKRQRWNVSCAPTQGKRVKGCSVKSCGRIVRDDLLTREEVQSLIKLTSGAMALGGASGGPTILDLHSGALSYRDKFINVYHLAKSSNVKLFFEAEFKAYSIVSRKIKQSVMKEFGPKNVYLTKPTFFSNITNRPAVTEHDEYWHSHIDKVTYCSFDYTCLVYLTTYGANFTGGQFVFDDSNSDDVPTQRIVQPREGRVSCFTSGRENVHHVVRVTSGTRLALTVAFTCERERAIPDPKPDAATTSAAVPD